MSDLMREEFEKWQAKETLGADLEHCGALIGDGPSRVSYRNMYVAERWIGWKASREALVIELPPSIGVTPIGGDSIQEFVDCNGEYLHGHAVVSAIHAAGVKTK